jgi:predicted flap endonuclease-1-like 5' DNA nuclease
MMSIHAIVNRRMKTRKAKGFSKAELKDAGLNVKEALKHSIPIDSRRSTKREENVKMLETYTKKMKAAPKKVEARTVTSKARTKIEEIEGIGPTYAKKLVEAGIKTTDDLLEAGATPKGRENLAAKTGISGKLILKWVNMADLIRIKGVGEEYSELLEVAGVDTVVELSKRVPENLHAKMLEVNEERKLVRRAPTLNEVKQWIDEAKTLPRKIEY